LQFRFSDGEGSVLQSWSENSIYLGAPQQDVMYTIDVRCSSDHLCSTAAVVDVDVDCPTTGALMQLFPDTILASSATEFSWSTPLEYDLHSGPLSGVSSYSGAVTSGSGDSTSIPAGPGPNQYYVLRLAGEFCNDSGSWSSAGSGESPGRDGALP
jgi:hypothetical protein